MSHIQLFSLGLLFTNDRLFFVEDDLFLLNLGLYFLLNNSDLKVFPLFFTTSKVSPSLVKQSFGLVISYFPKHVHRLRILNFPVSHQSFLFCKDNLKPSKFGNSARFSKQGILKGSVAVIERRAATGKIRISSQERHISEIGDEKKDVVILPEPERKAYSSRLKQRIFSLNPPNTLPA